MNLTIRKIKREECLDVTRLSSLAFEWVLDSAPSADPEAYAADVKANPKSRYDKYWQERWAAFTEDGTMVSALANLPYEVYFDGHTVGMVGIGSVCSLPPYRRMGGIRRCFGAMLQEAYAQGRVFSFLYPFSQYYYEQFGYRLFEPQTGWKLHLKYIPPCKETLCFTLYDGSADTSGFAQAYEKFTRFNMMPLREDCEWASTPSDCNPYKTNKQAYICRDAEGQAVGFILFQKQKEGTERIMQVLDLAYDSIGTLWQILNFCARFAADYDFIKFAAPAHLNLERFCTDFPQSGSGAMRLLNGMVRVVDVSKALTLCAYKGTGQVVLKITDGQLLQNSATFKAVFADGVAVSVTQTEETPDCELGIGDFSAAICGRYSTEELCDMQGVTVRNPLALEAVFYKKPMFISTFF